MKANPYAAPIVVPSIQPQPHNKYYAQASAHTGGKNHADVSNQTDSTMVIDWSTGVKIDQIRHGIYLPHFIMDNGIADAIQDITDMLGNEIMLPCGISGYHMKNEKGGNAYTVRLGITHGKHHIGNLFVCPLPGYGNLPFLCMDTYTHKIQRLGLTNAYQAFLAMLFTLAVVEHVLESRVSRLDFAVDLPLNPTQYLWFALGVRSHLAYEGQTPTWYFGGVKSAWRMRVYNKKIQLLDQPQPLAITSPHMLRVEISLGNGKGIPHGNPALLVNSKNHWLQVHPIRIADIASVIKECQDPAELTKAVEMGLHAYLRTFGTTKRSAYSKKLRELQPPPEWKPDAIWDECLELLNTSPFVTLY